MSSKSLRGACTCAVGPVLGLEVSKDCIVCLVKCLDYQMAPLGRQTAPSWPLPSNACSRLFYVDDIRTLYVAPISPGSTRRLYDSRIDCVSCASAPSHNCCNRRLPPKDPKNCDCVMKQADVRRNTSTPEADCMCELAKVDVCSEICLAWICKRTFEGVVLNGLQIIRALQHP